MDTAALYLRKPFFKTMERAIELKYKAPVPPTKEVQKYSTCEKIVYCVETLFYLAMIPITLSLLGCAAFVDGVCNQKQYSVLEGNGDQIKKIQTVMTWNVCMLYGGLPVPFGGLKPASYRTAHVAGKILENGGSDLVCLQEVSQDAAYNLYDALKEKYRFFYFKINPDSALALDSSLFVASKAPLKDVDVIAIPQQGRIRRAAFTFKSDDITFTTTHLEAGGKDGEETRLEQAKAIVKANNAGKQILLGDLNMRRDVFQKSAFKGFIDSVPQGEPTATDDFSKEVRPKMDAEEARVDYIASKNVPLMAYQGKCYDKQAGWAISDHQPIYAKILA